ERGQTVYRAVRTIPASVRGVGVRRIVRNVSDNVGSGYQQASADSVKEPQRVIVFRQNTPTGTVLVRKAVPSGTPLPRTVNVASNGGVVRRFVTREAIARPLRGSDV
ncbi:unnamed protein product, partial [Strongylus vulgaris]